MNYIGSKLKLSSWIYEEIRKVVGHDLSDKIFCDMFAGTSIVGRTFKSHVKKVIANDIEYYSFVLNKNYIENHEKIENQHELIEELNSLPLSYDGFIFKNYCHGSGSGRQYFSDENGQKIDAIRLKIQEWKKTKKIDEKIYFFLLASLIESADKVANTASVYGAFLKHVKASAKKDLLLESANFELTNSSHEVHCEDSNELIKKISGDILYLDPPYNQRQYGANYHLLNTIAKYDDFTPKGVSGLREYNRSNYCKKQIVAHEFDCLIKNANFKYIFLSYNNEGLLSEEQTRDIMQKYGTYHLKKKHYQRFRADKAQNRNHKANSTYEYLHVLKKRI